MLISFFRNHIGFPPIFFSLVARSVIRWLLGLFIGTCVLTMTTLDAVWFPLRELTWAPRIPCGEESKLGEVSTCNGRIASNTSSPVPGTVVEA